MDRKTIGFVSVADPFHDRKAWSGTIFKLRESIENAGYVVVWIPVKPNKFLVKLLNVTIKLLLGRDKKCTLLNVYFLLCAKSIERSQIEKCDCLFFPGGAQIANYIKYRLPPYIFFADATFKIMKDYYFFGYPQKLIRSIETTEKKAILNSAINIRTSKWAADSVIYDYGYSKEKTFVIELGANIDEQDIVTSEEYNNGMFNILFSGVEWERKGASIAIETARALIAKGLSVKLFLCGIPLKDIPSDYRNLSFVDYLGFLNKNNKIEYEKYINTIKKSHILLLPTKAECSATVCCEALAYRLPIFTCDTGGLPNYVVNEVNGYRLPINASPEDFAEKIISTIKNKKMSQLRLGCAKMYQEKINWHAFSVSFKRIIEEEL